MSKIMIIIMIIMPMHQLIENVQTNDLYIDYDLQKIQMSNQYQKVNTFSRKPSLAQIASYIVVLLESIVFYAFIQPYYQQESSRIVFIVLYSCSILSVVITTFICSYTDPSDSIMIECKKGNYNKFSNKLEDMLYCDYCQSYVTEDSRHCRQCDRCVQKFDHHCMWINNCVGVKNYKSFLAMIISAFLNLLIYVVALAVLTVQNGWGQFLGLIIFAWVILAVVSIFCLLVLNLILLHIYLGCKGYTTYQFIVARREEQRLQQLKKIDQRREEKQRKMKALLQQKKSKVDIEKMRTTVKVVEMESQQTISKLQPGQSKISKDIGSDPSDKKLYTESIHVVFEEKEVTEKSQSEDKSVQKKEFQEKIQSQSEEEIKISQFFMKNKSLNLFIQKQIPDKPQRKGLNASAVISDKKNEENIKKRSKSKSQKKK